MYLEVSLPEYTTLQWFTSSCILDYPLQAKEKAKNPNETIRANLLITNHPRIWQNNQ